MTWMCLADFRNFHRNCAMKYLFRNFSTYSTGNIPEKFIIYSFVKSLIEDTEVVKYIRFFFYLSEIH